MIKRSYSWLLIFLNYETSILLICHDNYDICIDNLLNNSEQGKCRLRLKLFCNFILTERINKLYIYNITASMSSVFIPQEIISYPGIKKIIGLMQIHFVFIIFWAKISPHRLLLLWFL